MHWRSKLIHSTVTAPSGFRSLVTPTYRGSTVLFDRQADVTDDWRQTEQGYTYGLYGSPTVMELGARIAEIEGARHSFVVPGGQAAIALIYLAFCKAGSHALVPVTAYGPNRSLADGLLKGLGITVEAYDPLIGAGIAGLIRDTTALIWTESPGSVTMEVQDVPAIVAAAHARFVPVALDNTYAAGVLFDAFAHGVDISMQALTKYVGGHSDLVAGAVLGRRDQVRQVKLLRGAIGTQLDPHSAWMIARSLETLSLRMNAACRSAETVTRFLSEHPQVAKVYYPSLLPAGSPERAVFDRQCTGAGTTFSFDIKGGQAEAFLFLNALQVFKLAVSLGGTESLVCHPATTVHSGVPKETRERIGISDATIRVSIGIEHTDDLIADLTQALAAAEG